MRSEFVLQRYGEPSGDGFRNSCNGFHVVVSGFVFVCCSSARHFGWHLKIAFMFVDVSVGVAYMCCLVNKNRRGCARVSKSVLRLSRFLRVVRFGTLSDEKA